MTRFVSPPTDTVVEVVAVVEVARATFLRNKVVVVAEIRVEMNPLTREPTIATVMKSLRAQMATLFQMSHASDAIFGGITATCVHTHRELG